MSITRNHSVVPRPRVGNESRSAATRERSLSQDSKPAPMVWPTPNDRDAELDQALRELGEDLLEPEIPERLLRVLRSVRPAQKKGKREEG